MQPKVALLRFDTHGTALAAAARIEKVAALRLLLDAGADVDVCGRNHSTALIAAVANKIYGLSKSC